MKSVVHNPQQVIGQLAMIKTKTPQERDAVSNAIACLHHMQNVVQRQRRKLTEWESKRAALAALAAGVMP